MYTSLYFLYFGVILTKCFWSRCFVSFLYSFDVYLYVNGSGSITSVGMESQFQKEALVHQREALQAKWMLDEYWKNHRFTQETEKNQTK